MTTQKPKKLAKRAEEAFNFLNDKEKWKKRIEILEENKEYGYALLNLWNMIEATIKLLWHYEHIQETYPSALDENLLTTDWQIIRVISQSHPEELKKIFNICLLEKEKNSTKNLHNLRNEIVHFNAVINRRKYNRYYNNAATILTILSEKLPSKDAFKEKLNEPKPNKTKN